MTLRVAIVIVSHSPLVARGAADMVREMVGEEVQVAHCGGNPVGGLGTDVAAIKTAIERVYSPAGVAVLVDLGGAVTNSEMAIELLPENWRERITICDAPLVEGAVMAATEAAGCSPLARVCASAERDRLASPDRTTPAAVASGNAVLRDPTGLHARPAVKLTKLAKRFAASVRMRAGDGDWMDAKSPSRVMRLKAREGETLSFRAEGVDALDAVQSLVDLVERDFGD